MSRMPNSAVASLTLVTPAALFRLLIRDFSSTTMNHSKPWHGCERRWSGPLVNCLMDMSSSLFLKPDVVLDLGLRQGLSLAPSGSSTTAMILPYTIDPFISPYQWSTKHSLFRFWHKVWRKGTFLVCKGVFNVFLPNPG